MAAPVTIVDHIRNAKLYPADQVVYIGRPGQGHNGYFGNPVELGRPCSVCRKVHRTKTDVIACFETYAVERMERDAEYRGKVAALAGKVLLCFCEPGSCHGDVLARLAQAQAQAQAQA